MPYSGSCHCGSVAFTVAGELPSEANSCNCSHCRRKGFLLTFVPEDQFTLDEGEDDLESYYFNDHKIEHLFCVHCGTEPFAQSGHTRAVNLRCVPECDLGALTINEVDGAAN